MNTAVRPSTFRMLHAFRQRRQRLLTLRAVLSTIIAALAGLVLVALLDRARLAPDWLRPWLSLAVYGGAGWVAWRVALRLMPVARDEVGLARLVESAAPVLKERLLSAVELGQSSARDSAEFRAQLQDDVEAAVATVDLEKALPTAVLRPWQHGALGALLLVGLLSCIPGLHLPGFLLRAAIPFANLARPSSVKISIVQPQPADQQVPFASEVELAIEVTAEVPKALLEITMPNGKAQQSELRRVTPHRYEGLIIVGQSDVEYRVIAADAITSWHRLTARPRARVIEFVKVITPPVYTGQPQINVTEDHGDIEALEGSQVKLRMKTNAMVSEGVFMRNPDQPGQSAPGPLKFADDGFLETEFTLGKEDQSWQVTLTDKATGFRNEEAAPWQIIAVPDLPPVTQVLEPVEQLQLLPDETLRLSGFASDDVGLASVQIAHAINGVDWQEKPLAGKSGKEISVQSVLPLGPLNVAPGDTVIIKLVATDLKGQKAESVPVRVVVVEQTVDPQLRQWVAEMRQVTLVAEKLTAQANSLAASAQQVQKDWRKMKKPEDRAKAEDALVRAQSDLELTLNRAGDLWEQLKQAGEQAPTVMDAGEVKLLGERLAHMRRVGLEQVKQEMRAEVPNPDVLRNAAVEAAKTASGLHIVAQTFAGEDQAKIVMQTALQLQRQETLLTDNALAANRDAAQRPKWQEQQQAATAASAGLREEMAALTPLVHRPERKQIEAMDKLIADATNDLRDSLDKADLTKSPEHLYGAADNLRQRLARTADVARTVQALAAQRAAQFRGSLQNQPQPVIAAVDAAQKALQQAAVEAKDQKRPPRQDREGLTAKQQAEKQLQAAARQLQDEAELNESIPLTPPQVALDASRAGRAAEKLATDVKQSPAQQETLAALQSNVTDLAETLRTLQADALAQVALGAQEQAAAMPISDPAQMLASPAELSRAASEAMKQVPNALHRVQAQDPELFKAAREAAESSTQATLQLEQLAKQAAEQPAQPRNEELAAQALAQAQQKTMEVAQQISGRADAARELLTEMAPSVNEMMRTVASELKETQEQTAKAASDAEAGKEVKEVAAQAANLGDEAEADAARLASLQSALRQEANAADLSQTDQRQAARMADVALSQIQKKAPEIAQNLQQAAQASQSQPQAQALQNAAAAQQQTAQALEQLAQNMQKMEQGQALSEQELAAMQGMEQDLGVKEPLDEAYERAQQLAQMAQDATQNPAAVLAELEKELPRNPSMQKALAELAKQTAQVSEQAVAAEAAQPSNIGLAAEQAAHDLQRVARHQQRLGQQEAAKETAQASHSLQSDAQKAKGQQGQPQQSTGQAAQAAAAQAAKAAQAAAAATPPAPAASPFQQIQSALLAQALDHLDQTVNPMRAQGGQPQGSGQNQQQAAQQSLSDAQQSQQQQMANQRSQGQTPGSQASQQKMAEGKPGQPADGQPAGEGNLQAMMQDGVLGGQLVLVEGDWGHLPSKMAEDLTEATRTEAAPEYRAAIESYYKAIANKARQ